MYEAFSKLGDLVFRDFLDIAHPFEVSADGFARHSVFGGKLINRLLTLDIVSDDLGFVAAIAACKTATALFAFVQLDAVSLTKSDYIRRTAKKSIFFTISLIISAMIRIF